MQTVYCVYCAVYIMMYIAVYKQCNYTGIDCVCSLRYLMMAIERE